MSEYNRGRRRSDHAFIRDRRRSRSPVQSRGYRGRPDDAPRVADPFSLADHVSYEYFGDWYMNLNPGTSIDTSMQKRYEDYTDDLLARTAKDFVAQHSGQAWFRDLYDGNEQIVPLRQPEQALFQQELDAGKYDQFTLDTDTNHSGYTLNTPLSPPLVMNGDVSPKVIRISDLPPNLSRATLRAYITGELKISGDLSVSAPAREDLTRCAWIILQGDGDMDKIITQLNATPLPTDTLGGYVFAASQHRQPKSDQRTRSLWAQLNNESVLEQHLAQVEAVCEMIEPAHDKSFLAKLKTTKQGDLAVRSQVDLAVEYLRMVHAFDYWELKQYDSLVDLEAHSPQYTRLPDTAADQAEYDEWQVAFDKKLQLYLKADESLRQLRIKPVSEAVSELISSKIKFEETDRYRCQVTDCTKLFKDVPFVRKHIEKRHGDWVTTITQEAERLRRYLLDPNKVLPYKEFRPVRPRRNSSGGARARRRSSPRGPRNGYMSRGGYGGRPEHRGSMTQNYRDLDKPAEELPELDY